MQTTGSVSLKEVVFSEATNKLIVRLDDTVSLEALKMLSPDTKAMASVDQSARSDAQKIKGVAVTLLCISPEMDCDFFSRCR